VCVLAEACGLFSVCSCLSVLLLRIMLFSANSSTWITHSKISGQCSSLEKCNTCGCFFLKSPDFTDNSRVTIGQSTSKLTLQSTNAITVPHWTIWSWYTGRWWVGCYIWYSEERTEQSHSPPRPLLAVLNATAHPSTTSVPITILLYNVLLPCSFNLPIKG